MLLPTDELELCKYFTRRFEAIDEKLWCVMTPDNYEGQHCVIGHLGGYNTTDRNKEIDTLNSLLVNNVDISIFSRHHDKGLDCINQAIWKINDGTIYSNNPKKNILHALSLAKQNILDKRTKQAQDKIYQILNTHQTQPKLLCQEL